MKYVFEFMKKIKYHLKKLLIILFKKKEKLLNIKISIYIIYINKFTLSFFLIFLQNMI
jgi:hypothetical protein